MEQDNGIYEGYMPDDGERLSGLKYSDSKKTPSFVEAGYGARAANLNAPRTQRLADVVGPSDYGNSTYDEQGFSMGQIENLEDTRANIQPFIDKFAAGVGTLAAKTALQTAGAYTMMTYGVGKMISSGEFNQLYNNDAMKALDEASESVDDTFKVYMKEADVNGSLFDRTIGSQHFWTKSFLGDMMSFVASAALSGGMAGAAMKGLKIGTQLTKLAAAGAEGAEIAAESLIGGTKAAKTIADVSNGLKLLSGSVKGADVTMGALRKAVGIEKIFNPIGKLSSGLIKNTLGAGYEAATEANGLIKEATQKYNTDFYNEHGRLPDDNELVDFHKKILDQSNGLFIGNLALLMASQVSTLPTIFGKGVNATIASARKGITSELVEGVEKLAIKSSQRNAFGKVLNAAKLAAKPLVMEGLIEEGGQNFGKNLAMDYIDKHYNPDSAKNIYDLTKSLGDSFNQTYMTIDGWQDIVSGMIVGGLGAPHIGNMGKFEEKEDGTKVWNKFGNLKDRKLINFKDAQNSWWTGGIAGQFQEAHENDLRAKELIDDYEKQKLEDAQEDFKNKLSKKLTDQEGIVSQIGDINHQNSSSTEYDDAIKKGDHFTAKNSEEDKFHLYVKSRVDAGYHSTLRSELIDPIKNLTPEEFGESFGYENMTKEELQERQNETIAQAEKSIKSTVDAIKFVDSNRTFNLGTEEGRLNRNMLIYAIATNKSIGNRIDKLNETVSKNIQGRVDYKIDTSELDKIQTGLEGLIEIDEDLINDAKISNDENELKLIPTYEARLEDNKAKLEQVQSDKSEATRIQNAREAIYTGKEKSKTVQDVKELLAQVKKNYKKVDESADEEKRYNDTIQSLEDLIKLYRRKEEALELYAITKDPENWKNFVDTERVFSKRIPQKVNEAGEKITESQNEEQYKAKDLVGKGESPENAGAKTGAPVSKIHKFLNNKLRKEALKLINKEAEFLKMINAGNEHQFADIAEFEEAIEEIIKDPNSTPEELAAAKIYDAELNKLHESSTPTIIEQVDTGELLSDKNQPEATDENEITKEINTKTTEALTAQERRQKRIEEGDKIVYAHDKIAWESELNGNKELNKKASVITQDFESLNVGDKLVLEPVADDNFEVYDKKDDVTTWGELKKTLTEDEIIGFIPITIKKDGVIVGMVHTTQFIKNGKTSGDPIEDTEKLIELRTHVLENRIFNSEVEYRGNGKLIGKKNKEGKINTEQRPTTEAFPDPSLVITISDEGKLDKRKLKAGTYEIINEDSIAKSKNSIQNAPYALLPVNKNAEGKIQYIAVPLSPRKLSDSNLEVAKTLSTLIRMYAQQKVNGTNEDLDRISSRISDMVMFKNKTSDVSSINGLKNIISMFTYNHTSFSDDLKLTPGKTKNSVIGVNEMKNGEFVVTFGVEGHLNIFKFKDGQASKWIGAAFTNVEIETAFNDLENELNSHFQSQIFYHNRSLMGTTVNIPILHEVNGMIDVKFESKSYEQLIKENTQTNLGSYNIGTQENPKYIYTVQGNITFKRPKIEEKKVEVKKVLNVNIKPEPVIEEFSLDGTKSDKPAKPQSRFKKKGGAKIEGLNDSLEGVVFSPSLTVQQPVRKYKVERLSDFGYTVAEIFKKTTNKDFKMVIRKGIADKTIIIKC